jgi:TatD DNase family protein
VLETDAPYLAPVPYRGKRNESAYLPHIATRLAEATGLTVEAIGAITTRNAELLFQR